MESDLISRDALLKDLRESVNWLHKIHVYLKYEDEKRICSAEIATFNEVIMRAKDAPAVDAVEVVRCKDCMFFQPYEGEEHKGNCEELVGLESCVYEDDFCSYGCKMEE